MTDFLLELSKNPRARAIVNALGLPIPLPQSLRRDRGQWQERPLADARAAVGASERAEFVTLLAETLTAAGSDTFVALPPPLAEGLPSARGDVRAPGSTARCVAGGDATRRHRLRCERSARRERR